MADMCYTVAIEKLRSVVSSLPEDLQPGSDFYGCSWEAVIVTALLGFLTVLVITCRACRSIKSRFYARRENKLGAQFNEFLGDKSEVLRKLSGVQKQYTDLQQCLQDSSQQKLLTEISHQKTLLETLHKSSSALEGNTSQLEQELEDEEKLSSELDDELAEVNGKIKALEDDIKKIRSQKEETRTTLKVFEINKGRLETSFQDAIEEKPRLQESINQLSKEMEGWEERFSELSENSNMLSSSTQFMQEDMNSKQSQVKSLIDNLLNMKDWSSEEEEADEEDDNSITNMKWDFENGEALGDPQKRTIKKLIFAAMLNASLKTMESEKTRIYDNLTDEAKAKEQLYDCIRNLQNTKQSLCSEKEHLESEGEKLKQKITVMSEMYQENERKLHRKLTVQEKERMQKEEKLSKVDEKINLASGELITVKTRVTELEEETEKTASSYQSQVTSYEKKSHDNYLIARAAERHLSDIKREAAHFRQKLTEAEYKLELLEKDPFALDGMQAIGRVYADVFINHQESSPYGPSPIGRAFLSPPTLLEGPLRLSPIIPGAERGLRPPSYYPAYPVAKERGEMNADRNADHQRTFSDAGSLSPPWEREQKMSIPPSGLLYTEPPFPPRRPERFYHYPAPSGRFSGPAELTRNHGKPFMDTADGRSSPEYKARSNTSMDGSETNDNSYIVSTQPPQKEGEGIDVPPVGYTAHRLPHPMRMPLLPMDPRGPYFRRPFPFPPPPMEMYGPPIYPGILPPHNITMRSPGPPQHYPPFPMHGDTFFPPQRLRSPAPRNEQPSEPVPPPTNETSDNQPKT